MEHVIALAPCRAALLQCVVSSIRLAINAGIHDEVPADSTVVDIHVYINPMVSLSINFIVTYPMPRVQQHSTS